MSLLALVAGCVSTTGQPTAPDERPPPPTTEPGAQTRTVTLALLDEAHQSARDGNLERAAQFIERAIRIEPRRGDLWLSLAEVHLQKQSYAHAEQYARKGLSLLQPGSRLERAAWLVIADAKDGLGDDGAARVIRREWRTYRG